MKIHPIQTFLALLAAICIGGFACAEPLSLKLDHADGVYQAGEFVSLFVEFDASVDTTEKTLQLKIWKNNIEVIHESEPPIPEPLTPLYRTTAENGDSLIFEVSLGDISDRVGAIIAPGALEPGSPRPDDFEAYWETQRKLLRELPFAVKKKPIALGDSESGYLAFDVEINAPGPRPARAIFAKPADAARKSLPIVLNLHAAGVKGDWCRAHLSDALANAKRGRGALSFDLNAHGMLNHEDESYYEALENGPLKNYWDLGVEDRDTYYFRFMYLRMLRSIEYLTQQPEWDGKRILVIGESQGGGQALAAAGLDPRVTAAVATVPAMCDFGGPLVGRKGGWPQPIDWRSENQAVIDTVAYFDAAHLLKGSQATLLVEIGLTDQTCPATSIYAAISQSDGMVTALPVPYRGHPWPEGEDREDWDQTVAAAKRTFIDEYLE